MHQWVCVYLLFELRFLLLHQFTLLSGVRGVFQQLKHQQKHSSQSRRSPKFNTNSPRGER